MDEIDPAPPKDGEAPWNVRNFGDASSFRSGVARPLASIVAVGAVACMLALAMRFANASGLDLSTRARAMTQAATQAPAPPAESCLPTAAAAPRAAREVEQTTAHASERLGKDEVRRLREQDHVRHLRGDDKPRAGRPSSRTPVAPPIVGRPSFLKSDPIQRSGNRFDPLNGAL